MWFFYLPLLPNFQALSPVPDYRPEFASSRNSISRKVIPPSLLLEWHSITVPYINI